MNRFLPAVFVLALVACGASDRAPESASEVHTGSTIGVNVNQKFQTIVGLGVNGQARMWGTGVAAKPALTMLVQEMNATVWRVEINSGLSNWEATNDNADPRSFNWTYYDALFQTKPFADLWAYLRHLNSLGVTNIELASHGTAPTWMGGINVPLSQYDEYVETQMAVLEYATTRIPDPKPMFRWFSPFNEPEIGNPPEGIVLSAGAAGDVAGRFAARLAAEQAIHPELARIKIVAPDAAFDGSTAPNGAYRQAVLSSVPANLLEAVAHHRYQTTTAFDWNGLATPEWLTETNSYHTCGAISWNPQATDLAIIAINHLKAGVGTVLVWNEWDAPHSHDGEAWRTMGLLGSSIPGVNCSSSAPVVLSNAQLDSATYTKKPTYHAFRQLAAFVQPGARRVQATTSDSDLNVTAVQNPDGTVALLGVNLGAAGTVTVNLSGVSAPVLTAWTTTATTAFVQGPPVLAASGSASFSIPASSVFAIAPTPGTSCVPTSDAGPDVVAKAEASVDAAAEAEAAPKPEPVAEAGADVVDAGADLVDASSDVVDASPEAEAGAPAPMVLVGESTQWSAADSIGTGAIEAFKYTAATTGATTRLFIYLTAGGRATKLGLYTHNAASNQPETLLASGAFTSVIGWNSVTVPATAVTSGATYWIAVLSTNGTLTFVEKSGSTGLGSLSTGVGFSALPATWSASGQLRWASSGMSAYARD